MTREDLCKTFAQNLISYMELKDVQQNELAEAIGTTSQAVHGWVSGTYIPRMDKIEKIAKFFGITKSELLEGRKNEYYFNDETAEIAQSVYESAELRQLFDACRDATPEQLKEYVRLVRALKGDYER